MGKKKPTIGYWYKLLLHFGWCRGPIDALLEIRGGDKTAWSGYQSTSGTITINAPELWGGEKGEGGIQGDFDVMLGEATQEPNAYLAANLGADQTAYRGRAGGVFKGGKWGAFNPYPKGAAFKLLRILMGWDDDTPWYPEKAPIGFEVPVAPDTFDEGAVVEVNWWQATYEQGTNDQATMGIGFYTSANVLIGAITYATLLSPPTTPPHNNWVSRSVSAAFPAAAAKLRIFQKKHRRTGTHNNGYIDDIEVSIDGVPLTVINPGAEAGVTGWVKVQGSLGREHSTGEAHSGDYYFSGAESGDSVFYQQFVPLVPDPSGFSMNAAHMLYESITGSADQGEPADLIDSASWIYAADKLFDEAFGLCTYYDSTAETPEEYQQRILNIIGGNISQSRTDGKYYLVLARSDYVLDDLPILTDADILEYEEEPSDPLESVNQVSIGWFDPTAKEKRTTIPLQSLGAIQACGAIIAETYQFPEIPTEELAKKVAARILAQKSTPVRRFRLTTNRTAFDWLSGQYFRLQAPRRGIEDMVCFVGDLDNGTPRSSTMNLQAVQEISTQPSLTYVGGEPGVDTGSPSTPEAPPAQAVIEAPYLELVARLSAPDLEAVDVAGGYLLAMAKQPSAGTSYNLWTKADGEDYQDSGNGDWCGTALVVEAGTADPGQVDFTLSGATDIEDIEVGSVADWGGETCRVDAIDPVGLTVTLGRGCGDTVPGIHAAGTRVWFYDDAAASDLREYTDGDIVSGKFRTRTSSQLLALADAPASTVTMDGRQARPYPPAKIQISGATPSGAAKSETFNVSWKHRDRLLQADQAIDNAAASTGPEAWTSYTLQVINDTTDAVILEQTGLGGDNTDVLLAADHAAIRLELWSVRDGLDSWQRQVTLPFAYTAGAAGAAYAAAHPGSPGQAPGTLAPAQTADLFAVGVGVDTIVATFAVAPTLVDGTLVRVRAAGPNTTAVTVNGVSVLKPGGVACAAGDIQTGQVLLLSYQSAAPHWDWVNAGGGGTASGNSISWAVHQVGHGLTIGNPVSRSGGNYVKADRDSPVLTAIGFVGAVSGADDFTFVLAGQETLTTAQWDAITGDSGGLTADEYYWSSSTAGGMTKIEPSTGIKQCLGVALSSTVFLVAIEAPFDLGAGVSYGVVPLGTVTAGSNLTTLPSGAIDLSLYKKVEIAFKFSNPTGSAVVVSLYYNTDVTATNYWEQGSTINNATPTYAKANDARIGNMDANETYTGTITIIKDADGKPRASVSGSRGAPASIILQAFEHAWTSNANVILLTFSFSVANSCEAGSSFTMHGYP